MSLSSTVLSTFADVLNKCAEGLPANTAISMDALLMAENLELYKTESGEIDTRLKKPSKGKKAPTDAEAALLVPVDADMPSGPVTALKPHQDAYSGHPTRLSVLDVALCVARKIDENAIIPGTNIGEPGANGKFYGEKQCTRKPKEGKLCTICAKKDKEAKAEPEKNINGWYGRLDEELYWKAFVIGCKHFFVRYPKGIAGDPTTAPASVQEPIPASVPASAPAPAPASEPLPSNVSDESPKVKKIPQKRVKKAVALIESAIEPKESVAVDCDIKECEWKTMFHNGMALIRNLKNGNVYQANSDFSTREEMVMKDKFEGRWIDGELNSYAEEIHDE